MFLVRKGNPKGIKDWADLSKPGVAVITPNPKTSGGARWNYLAAWGYALKQPGGSDAKAQRVRRRALSSNVPVLDSGARGSTTTFVERGIGDVLLAWENEALLAVKELGAGQVRDRLSRRSASWPSRRSPWSTSNVDRKGTRDGRARRTSSSCTRRGPGDRRAELLPADAIRPSRREVRRAVSRSSSSSRSTSVFGGWAEAQAKYFADGGVFDQIYEPQDAADAPLTMSAAHADRLTGREATQRAAGLRPEPRLHAVLPVPDRADPAGGALLQAPPRSAGTAFWEAVTAPRVLASYRLTLRRLAASPR